MSDTTMKPDRPVVVLEKGLRTEAWQRLFRVGREQGWVLLDLRFSGNDIPRGLRPTGAFVNKLADSPLVSRLLDAGCHVIRLGTAPHDNDHIVPAVLPDLTRTGELAAEHFAERGFRHLAFVRHKPWGMYQPLYDGFHTQATELGCECHSYQWTAVSGHDGENVAGNRYRKRLKLFTGWLADMPKPMGLLAFNDNRAGLYSRMCMDVGFDVPTDIGIMGVGNDETICETVYPPISSIVADEKTIVAKAVGLFDKLSSGEEPAETTIFVPPSGLVTRRSSDVFAAKIPGVAKAIRFIIDHYAEPIGIEEITRASGMSRARLFVAFGNDLDHPPVAILTRIRIDKAKHMLRGTREKVSTIAQACGFGASINMYHHFRQQVGMSPNTYRQTRSQQV